MNKKLLAIPALMLAVGVAGFSTQASAASLGVNAGWNGNGLNVRAGTSTNPGGPMRMPGVFGTVTAVNGDTITVSSKGFGQNATATTYTVDATNATVTKNNAASSVSAIAVGDTIMAQGTVSGTSVTATKINDGVMAQRAPGVRGTVTAISGDTITVSSKGFGQSATTTTYTVDATNATVTKSGAASSVSAIAVGDTIMVQGTVSGTSVTATKINDGVMAGGKSGSNGSTAIPAGNGQPIIGGTVTAVNGDTITITNKGNTSYTIDVTNATITKDGTASNASSIAVGDTVLAQGTVNGTSVTAVSLTDSASTTGSSSTTHTGFFGMIGAFFSKLF